MHFMLDICNIRDLNVSVIVAYVLDKANWDLQIGTATYTFPKQRSGKWLLFREKGDYSSVSSL
jgi:hypothetical protein